jgi:hypothetical protein
MRCACFWLAFLSLAVPFLSPKESLSPPLPLESVLAQKCGFPSHVQELKPRRVSNDAIVIMIYELLHLLRIDFHLRNVRMLSTDQLATCIWSVFTLTGAGAPCIWTYGLGEPITSSSHQISSTSSSADWVQLMHFYLINTWGMRQ